MPYNDDDDDGSTTVRTVAILTHDGCCVKHPTIVLKGMHADGTKFLKDNCPLCDSEYQALQTARQAKQEALEQELRALENQSSDPPLASQKPQADRYQPPAPGYVPQQQQAYAAPPQAASAADNTLLIQQVYDKLLDQKDAQIRDLQAQVQSQQTLITDLKIQAAVLEEKLSTLQVTHQQALELAVLKGGGSGSGAGGDVNSIPPSALLAATSAASNNSNATSRTANHTALNSSNKDAPAPAQAQAPAQNASSRFDQSGDSAMWGSALMDEPLVNENELQNSSHLSSSAPSADKNNTTVPQQLDTSQTSNQVSEDEELTYDQSHVNKAVPASDHFTPKVVTDPNEPQPVVEDDNTSLGNTVASSTYGEDRQKVVNHTVTDPYGDQGMYTGVILRSTGMPHGLGRMVYEEDGRVYEGDWRHGRWRKYNNIVYQYIPMILETLILALSLLCLFYSFHRRLWKGLLFQRRLL